MEALCMTGMLLHMSIEDIRKKTVPVIPMMLWGMAGVILHLYFGRISCERMLGGLITGITAYILSIATHEKIGKGDAVLLTVTGIYMGFWGNVFMLWLGLVLAAAAGACVMVLSDKDKSYELPFVPFLFAGFLITVLCNGGMPT
ncbi:MAG: prepilin peptidase [Lachnospiraceae bacterium]|nr:prepilin peptidase [Lachnospiraceae bacterium]